MLSVVLSIAGLFPTGALALSDERSDPLKPRRTMITLNGSGAEVPTESAALKAAKAAAPNNMRQYETRHFVILSNADPSWTTQQGEHLERTKHQFDRTMRLLRQTTSPLQHKLVCVLFASRAEYAAFGRDHDRLTETSIAGYYSPRHDRTVFYDQGTNPNVGRAHADLQSMVDEIAQLEDQAKWADSAGRHAAADAIRRTVDEYRRHLSQERAKVGEFVHHASTSTTVHEAVHHLMFHTGVQSRDVRYPVWISEGLATAFETDRTSGAFGPDFESTIRREGFEHIFRDGRILDLETLITLTGTPSGASRGANALYHQSYALVTWMFRFRRGELCEYLRLMRSECDHQPTPEELQSIFERAFGDVAELERAWLRHERGRLTTE